MIIEIHGNIQRPVYEINPHHDMIITHHHKAIADRRVEVMFGSVHVFMSPEESDGLGKNLQTLSGVEKTVDQLGLARHHLRTGSMAPNATAYLAAALTEVIDYLEAQRALQAAAMSPWDAR